MHVYHQDNGEQKELPRLTRIKETVARFEAVRKIVHAPDIIRTINCVPCIFFFYRLLIPPSFIQRVLIIGLVSPPFFLFSKTHSGSSGANRSRDRIPATVDFRRNLSSVNYSVSTISCRATLQSAPLLGASTHDCSRKEHALTQILCRLKQRYEL